MDGTAKRELQGYKRKLAYGNEKVSLKVAPWEDKDEQEHRLISDLIKKTQKQIDDIETNKIQGSRFSYKNSIITRSRKGLSTSQGFETKKSFETQKMLVLIEAKTYSGSAFGVEEGDAVFFSKRLVIFINCRGRRSRNQYIPNYSDKRDDIK